MTTAAPESPTTTTCIANQERLLHLAGVYRQISRRELARALGRDSSKLVRATGNPKTDYLVRLATLLDWPVGDVVEAIRGDVDEADDASSDRGRSGMSYREANEAALAAYRVGAYERMLQCARRMAAAAKTPDERARAALREAGGWDGLGRYPRVLDAVRRGLEEHGCGDDTRLLLQVNLANAHYTLWRPFEAAGAARQLIEELRAVTDADPRPQRAALAFAHYVLGHANRRLIAERPDDVDRWAADAARALDESMTRYERLADEFDNDAWRGVAHTCRGGRLEIDAATGVIVASDALERIEADVRKALHDDGDLVGDQLESRGWWCIFGCNIALRALEGAELQQWVSQFAEAGRTIADRLNNWAIRERVFTMEMRRRDRLRELAGVPVEWPLDSEGVRLVVGAMGRFPAFRSTGWRILETATLIGSA